MGFYKINSLECCLLDIFNNINEIINGIIKIIDINDNRTALQPYLFGLTC